MSEISITWNKEWDKSEEICDKEKSYWEMYDHYRERLAGPLTICYSLMS